MTELTPTPQKEDNELDRAVDIGNNRAQRGSIDQALEIGNSNKPRPAELDPWEHAGSAARRMFEDTPTPSTDQERRKQKRGRALAKTAGVVGGLAALGGLVNHVTEGPEFSEETITHTVQQGDDEWTIANQIEGIESVNDKQDVIAHIKSDPANAEVYEDGHINPGEPLVIPKEVKN